MQDDLIRFFSTTEISVFKGLFFITTAFFLTSIFIVILLSALSTTTFIKKRDKKNRNKLIMVLIILLALPVGVSTMALQKSLGKSSKAYSIGIVFKESVPLDDSSYLVNIETKSPHILYLKAKLPTGDFETITPTYSLEKRKLHSFIIPREHLDDLYIVAEDLEMPFDISD